MAQFSFHGSSPPTYWVHLRGCKQQPKSSHYLHTAAPKKEGEAQVYFEKKEL